MSDLSWFSEPYPPGGASAADGIRKQLGSPELDLLTILVRESAQNSWDARLPDSSRPVEYAIDLRTVGVAHMQYWRDLLLRGAPINDHLPIRGVLQAPTIRVMTVSDRGTRGLGGPTRADHVLDDDHDFVSFVRNIGEPRDTELGGGTYGFGRGIFYLLSRPGTILLYTRCVIDGNHESRLMGCALWRSHVVGGPDGDRRHTGRHWWGDISGEIVEPLIGAEADVTAHRLGLDTYGERETGTTIVVIDPKLGDPDLPEPSPQEAADHLAETIVWHLWPKMLAAAGRPAMRFSVTCDGFDHPVPDPRTTRPLKLFVAAYEKATGAEGRRLECLRPKRYLGRFGLVSRTSPAPESTRASRVVGIDGLVHHVCLMRAAELVVTYLPCRKPASELQSYAGVFRADEELDDTYASAEPPTHDAWNAESLDYPASRFVNTTFRRIDEEINGLLDLGGDVRDGVASVALGAASTLFSSLLGGVSGMGGASDFGRPGGTESSTGESSKVDENGQGIATTGGRPDAAHAGATRGMGAAGSVDHEPDGWTGGSSSRDPAGATDGPGSPGGSAVQGYSGSAGGTGFPGGTGMTGGDTQPVPGGSRRVDYVGDPYYDERDGVSVLIQEFRLPIPGRQRVRAELSVILAGAGARETDPPRGAAMPDMLGWESPGGIRSNAESCDISGGDGTTWRAIVRPAPDTMTEIEIRSGAVQD